MSDTRVGRQTVYDLSELVVKPAGDSALHRLKNHVDGWHSVKSYGVLGDGSTDDTAGFVAAAAAAASTGQTLLVTCKVRLAGAAGTITAPIRFEGGGSLDLRTGGSVKLPAEVIAGAHQIFWYNGGTLDASAVATPLLVEWWGAKADSTGASASGTNNSTPVINALNAANGVEIVFGKGIYRFGSTLSAGYSGAGIFSGATATQIRMRGAGPAYITHAYLSASNVDNIIADTASSSYTDTPNSTAAARYTILLCDGTDLLGTPDTGGNIGGTPSLRSLKNLVVWGVNSAQDGVYLGNNSTPQPNEDVHVEDVTFVLFSRWGILYRSASVSTFRRVAFIDCGYGLAEAGTLTYPSTYYSGCGALFTASMVASDYSAQTSRPTSLTFDTLWFWVRSHTLANKSGLRGLQLQAPLSSAITALQGYTGSYIYLATGTTINGTHLENYAAHGPTAADALPGRALPPGLHRIDRRLLHLQPVRPQHRQRPHHRRNELQLDREPCGRDADLRLQHPGYGDRAVESDACRSTTRPLARAPRNLRRLRVQRGHW
jgi:hypothetical protein